MAPGDSFSLARLRTPAHATQNTIRTRNVTFPCLTMASPSPPSRMLSRQRLLRTEGERHGSGSPPTSSSSTNAKTGDVGVRDYHMGPRGIEHRQ